MDDIKKRLSTATEECLKKYDAWEDSKKSSSTREDLQDAVHELRKVASRFEIEIAISEREEVSSKHLPIPPHRANKSRKSQSEEEKSVREEASGNQDGGGVTVQKVSKPRRRKPRTAEGSAS